MMAEPAFSPEIERALDAYAVPPVPQGLSDRLMTRIASGNTKMASGDTGVNAASVALPASRPRRASPWRRTGRIVGVVATFSLATATAAAAGIFGEPVYVPGVSEALVEAKIVEAPKPAMPPKVRMVAEAKPAETVPPPPATGSAAVVNKVTELRNNPEFAKLAPRQRRAVAGREVRNMVRSGEASRQDVRTAVRELAQNADPATKEAWRKASAERREQRLERRAQRLAALEEPQATTDAVAATSDPVIATDESLPVVEPAELTAEKTEALRERIRAATPEQRAALRAALRERRQIRQQRRQ